MRKYAFLKSPVDNIKKVMIYAYKDGVCVFWYNTTDDVSCAADDWCENLEEAEARCAEVCEIKQEEWIMVDDPFEFCQDDIIAPVRVKGRDTGKPQWGKFEKLINGKWVEIT